jgi:hypothetical protein
MSVNKGTIVLITLSSFLMAGCQSQSVDSTVSNASDRLPKIVSGSTPSETEKSKLLAAKDLLFTKLSTRLMDALSTSGPARAIGICQVEAKSIATEVGKEAGVEIGRTGVRLRNTSNQPPAWAKELVAARTNEPVFAELSNGHAAALLPIKLQPQCLMCHGPKEQLIPEVKEQLAKLYPEDSATGFSEGELRGWFWVELLD